MHRNKDNKVTYIISVKNIEIGLTIKHLSTVTWNYSFDGAYRPVLVTNLNPYKFVRQQQSKLTQKFQVLFDDH